MVRERIKSNSEVRRLVEAAANSWLFIAHRFSSYPVAGHDQPADFHIGAVTRIAASDTLVYAVTV